MMIPDLTPQHVCECGDCDGGRMEDRCMFAELLESIFHALESGGMSEVYHAAEQAHRQLEQQEQINLKANEGEDEEDS